MGPLAALTKGIQRAARYWPVWLALWAATLISGLPLAVTPALGLAELARRPVIAEMAGGMQAEHLFDALRLVNNGQAIPDQPDLATPVLSSQAGWVVLAPLALLALGGIVSAFAWGGMLLTYHEAPEPFRLRRFMWGGWRWFGAFLLLAAIQVVVALVIFLPLLGLAAALIGSGQVGTVIAVALLVGVAGLLLAVFELARVQAVGNNTRNVIRALGLALRTIARRMPALMAFYALALLGLLLVHGLFRGLLLPDLPLDALPLALVYQQGFVLARLLARAARVAGLVAMVGRGSEVEE